MAFAARTVKVFETEAFSLLTRGARLFRFSLTQPDAHPSHLQRSDGQPDEMGVASVDVASLPAEHPEQTTASWMDRLPEQGHAEAEGTGVQARRLCQTCVEEFEDATAQRRHYRLDWHRCNLHRALRNQPPVAEEQFAALVDADGLSSISGSASGSQGAESDCEECEAPTNERGAGAGPEGDRNIRVYLENEERQVFSVHRCLLHPKKATPTEDELVAACCALGANTRWAIVLAGGGHFAAAIFHGGEMCFHKTFHTYTVRRGQGTAQGLRDARGNAPKSAGAALRRRNERSLAQDVDLLLSTTWRAALAACTLLFVRASPQQRAKLWLGDPRVRRLPFATRRATLAECTRAHALLATAHTHGLAHAYQLQLQAEQVKSLPAKMAARPKQFVRYASREPRQPRQPRQQPEQPESSSSDESSGQYELELQMELVDLTELREYETSSGRKPRRRRRGGKAVGKNMHGVKGAVEGQKDIGSVEQLVPGEVDEGPGDSDGGGGISEAVRREKRAAARRVRRGRMREKREREMRAQEEAKERDRFLLLSDREKRALAAERRLACSDGPALVVRCFRCAGDMTGKVPFCYLELRFCSVACLQAHRKARL